MGARNSRKGEILTSEIVRELFQYDPMTGELRHKKIRGRAKNGETAGCIDNKGYVKISIYGVTYRAHRVIWLHFYGEWPTSLVDHRNRIKSDNRISNLRLATSSQNCSNKLISASKGGRIKGVYWRKDLSKWKAQIVSNRKYKHLGYFESAEEAHEVYCLAADLLHGEFANYGDAART